MINLNLKLLVDLRALGVTKITFTRKASEQLMEGVKGLYKPDAEIPAEFAADDALFGKFCGIEIYRETQ